MISETALQRLATGRHVVALDFDGVLCGTAPDDWGAELDDAVVRLARALSRSERATLVVTSPRALGDLAPRCARISPVWVVADAGRVAVDPARRLQWSPLSLEQRLAQIVLASSAESSFYAGPATPERLRLMAALVEVVA